MAKAEFDAGFPPLAEILPHRPPLLLLDALEACHGHDATCSVVLRPGTPYVGESGASPLLGLEILAQGAAALFGYRAWLSGQTFEGGALVGVRKLGLHAPRLPVGVVLYTHVRERWTIDAMSLLDCSLRSSERTLASAQLTVAVGRFEEYVE